MPFAIPPFTSIRDTLLRDLKNQLPDADTGPDSDFFVRASATASSAARRDASVPVTGTSSRKSALWSRSQSR